MMDTSKKFSLYPCCILTQGKQRALITDIQRCKYKLIPLSLYVLLSDYKEYTIEQIIEKFPNEETTILKYYRFLLEKEWGLLEKQGESMFKPIAPVFYNPMLITNAIFDYDRYSQYSIPSAISKLEELHCENLEIRFYDVFDLDFICNNVINSLEGTSIRNLELLMQFTNENSIQRIIDIYKMCPRLRKVTIVSVPKQFEKILNNGELVVILTSEIVRSETSCGVIKPCYFTPETAMYLESLHYNNCLNAKISVDRYGNIKNCPSMTQIYGHIERNTLVDIASMPEFQKLWHIKKDDIKVCKECEFRYMCHDCRAYLIHPDDICSKPQKCSYNPSKQ
ncbi:MAG: grasp-with-spasm system SPASM domain peptide maturase [Bacteroidales bacterium]|nr:grasp-with-spasm system SPASM domain peptide maturase [Bacteroidales bacterium]